MLAPRTSPNIYGMAFLRLIPLLNGAEQQIPCDTPCGHWLQPSGAAELMGIGGQTSAVFVGEAVKRIRAQCRGPKLQDHFCLPLLLLNRAAVVVLEQNASCMMSSLCCWV